jgi:hypothetical protein
MTKKKQPTATKRFIVVFQDGYKKEFEAETRNAAAAKALAWATKPANGRGGKSIILTTTEL